MTKKKTSRHRSVHDRKAQRESRANRIRGEIRASRDTPIRETIPLEGYLSWATRYHKLICDYLLTHLETKEVASWRVAYTALYELTGTVFAERDDNADTFEREKDAWAKLDVETHLELKQVFTLLPPRFSHRMFLTHYIGFVRYACLDGAISPDDAARVMAEFKGVLAAEGLCAA